MSSSNPDDAKKGIRVIPFKGTQEEWRMWSRKFLARATMKGYKTILTGTQLVPNSTAIIDESTATGKLEAQARLKNEQAYNELLMLCMEEVCFGAVDEATTTNLPDGDAKKAWDNLITKYEPKTTASLVQVKLEFAENKLSDPSKDPDEWISSLERLRQRLKDMKSPISDMDLIIHILNNVPKEYETLVESLEGNLSTLQLDALRD